VSRSSPDEQPADALEARVAARWDELSATERNVAAFFVRQRAEVPFLSAAGMARHMGTSDATVVRTAQALGYAGLQELKRECAAALLAHAPPASQRGVPAAGAEDALQAVIDRQIALLQTLPRAVSPESFARSVDILHAADRLMLFATDGHAFLAESYAGRLLRIGRIAAALTSTDSRLVDPLLGIRAGDALVLLAPAGIHPAGAVALDHARTRGIPVVLIGADADAARPGVSQRLAIPGAHSGADDLVAWVALLDALVAGLVARDPARAASARSAWDALHARLTDTVR
jgi:DNA-binding MurR/RpiR family transcriptional regulator